MAIQLKDNGKIYTLEYTRKSVETMERGGFHFDEMRAMPVTMIPTLFHGAFLARHKFIKKDTIEELFNRLSGKNELFEALVAMYAETVNSLLDSGADNEDDGKNVTWEKV